MAVILGISARYMKSCENKNISRQAFVSNDASFQITAPLNWVKHNGKEEYEEDLLLTYDNPKRKGRVTRVDSRAVLGVTELEYCTEDIVESYMYTYVGNMEEQIVKGMEKGKIEKQDINENESLYIIDFKGNVQEEKIIYKFAVLKSKERFFHILAYDDEETFSKVENDIDEMMKSIIVYNKN